MGLNKNTKIEHSLATFPEEITEDGVKIYGETSYENQMAVLSQYLHNAEINNETIEDKDRRRDIILAIQEFLNATKQKVCKVSGADSYRAYYNIGVIYECTGRVESALKYYKMCGEFEPAKSRINLLK